MGVGVFESRLDGLVRGRRELDALEAQWLFMVGEYARSGEWQADGFLTAAAAIQKRCHLDGGTARRTAHLAKRLERLPATQKAFDNGDISRAHAQVLANGYTDARAEELAHIEGDLVDFARQVDPKSLRAAVQRYTDAIDGDGGAKKDENAAAKNRFHASPVGDRVSAGGSLDTESGEILITAIHAMAAQLRETATNAASRSATPTRWSRSVAGRSAKITTPAPPGGAASRN